MKLETKIIPYTLEFKHPAKTSRGEYTEHKVWYIILTSPDAPRQWGIGECAPLPDLSCDFGEDYETKIADECKKLEETGLIDHNSLRNYPSILFGLETALLHFERNKFELFDTEFTKGKNGIPINGLIWMGDYSYMAEQIHAKIAQRINCIKLKIGAIDFDKEIKLLTDIRKEFDKSRVTLRVDANGAFSPEDAMDKLQQLSKLDIHSIEQPIKAGQWDEMKKLCENTPIPIALDEELIGVNTIPDKRRLLDKIKPQYIILKPSLHGGMHGCKEWIELAEENKIGWWITSALESNIGLNAIAQWCSTFNTTMPQGLGTGSLYTNNIKLPLIVRGNCLWYDPFGRKCSINEVK